MGNNGNGNNNGNYNKTERRKHLRSRFLMASGQGVFNDEILELILHSAHPSLNVRKIAHRLIEKFSGFSRIFSADLDDLRSIQGVNDSMTTSILCVKETLKRMLQEEMKTLPVVNNWEKLIKYLQISVGQHNKENFRAIYLNKRHRVVADDLQNFGTIDQTPFYIREIMKRALIIGASGLVISHNHPGGDIRPSRSDLLITMQLGKVCTSMKIKLIDHIIVTPKDYFSFKQEGLL